MRKIVVVDYRPEWAEAFAREAARIANVLGENMVAIHHIGSTSVPGLCAKPILDIMPVVRDIGAVDECNEGFIALGYTPMGEFGIPGRRYFHKGGDAVSYTHLDVYKRQEYIGENTVRFRATMDGRADAEIHFDVNYTPTLANYLSLIHI